MKCPHTAVRTGKRVLVILRDGAKIIDRFVETSKQGVHLKERGIINLRDVKSMSIWRNNEK